MPQPEPLTHDQMERLWRWERQLTWLHAAAMGGFLLAGVAANRFGDLAWLNQPLLAGAIALLLVAGVLQLRERCPRCGTRLRSKILRLLPDKCFACGVAFPRRPA
jgi:hypothetical protein